MHDVHVQHKLSKLAERLMVGATPRINEISTTHRHDQPRVFPLFPFSDEAHRFWANERIYHLVWILNEPGRAAQVSRSVFRSSFTFNFDIIRGSRLVARYPRRNLFARIDPRSRVSISRPLADYSTPIREVTHEIFAFRIDLPFLPFRDLLFARVRIRFNEKAERPVIGGRVFAIVTSFFDVFRVLRRGHTLGSMGVITNVQLRAPGGNFTAWIEWHARSTSTSMTRFTRATRPCSGQPPGSDLRDFYAVIFWLCRVMIE